MTLARATFRDSPLDLPGSAPFPCDVLRPWVGKRVTLPCDDPWVRGTGSTAHAYLDASRDAWIEHPDHMDFLEPDSPVHDLKALERDLVLHHWDRWLEGTRSVLDVGCGIGRFATALLDRGLDVIGVDADLESLRHLLWHAAGRKGRLDLNWSSVHHLPEATVDVALAVEILCYVPDVVPALRGIAERVRPGGLVLWSVEARWGWAAAQDAPEGGLRAALGGDGVVDLPGHWVRTYDREAVEEVTRAAGLELVDLVPSHWIPDGPLEDLVGEHATLDEVIEAEVACRVHPVWAPLHRLWLVAARRPEAW